MKKAIKLLKTKLKLLDSIVEEANEGGYSLPKKLVEARTGIEYSIELLKQNRKPK